MSKVPSDDGGVFGMVVINVDLRRLFSELASMTSGSVRMMVANARGDYLVHLDPGKTYGSDLGHDANFFRDFPSAQQMRPDQKGLSLDLSFAPELPQTVRGDAIRLAQILHNLVSNAVKFTEKGSVRVTVRREPEVVSGKVRVAIAVEDTGIGIDPADQRRVFLEELFAAHPERLAPLLATMSRELDDARRDLATAFERRDAAAIRAIRHKLHSAIAQLELKELDQVLTRVVAGEPQEPLRTQALALLKAASEELAARAGRNAAVIS